MKLSSSTTLTLGLTSLTLLSGLILSSSLTSADDATDVVTITVPTSCSMSSTGTNSHTAELGNGQSNSTIGETTITTYCNDNEGFAIYAIGYTGDTLGNTVLTDTSLGSTHDIVTGTATSGNTSNWAMKLSTISSPAPNFPIIISGTTSDTLKEQGDPDFSNFQQVPDDYTKVAYRTAGTDTGTNAEGSTIKTTYQAYISPTQSAGTYSGKVKYALIHPNTAPTPEKPANVTPPTSCSTPLPGAVYMQSINDDNRNFIINNVTEGEKYYIVDKRDNEPYCVSVKSGTIWMRENLRISGVVPANGSNFTGNDINISQCDLNKNVGECAEATNRNSYNIPMTHTTNGYGTYYNYAAASAGTVIGNNDNTEASEDICPANWKIPSYKDENNAADFSNSPNWLVYNNPDGDSSGKYYSGSLVHTGGIIDGEAATEIFYWSTTASGADSRKSFYYHPMKDIGYSTPNRQAGLFIRCVQSNTTN